MLVVLTTSSSLMTGVRGPSSSSLAAGDSGHAIVVAGGCKWWTRPGVVLVAIVDVGDGLGVVVRRAMLPLTMLGVGWGSSRH